MNWHKTESWIYEGHTFRVEVKHWLAGKENMWNVYAYLYPDHPRFAELAACKEAFPDTNLTLHGGCTYFRKYATPEGRIQSVQIGCDYHHCGDEMEDVATREKASNVFWDAEALVKELGGD